MTLDDRKLKILQAIISDYIATAEPVGSRTIAKKYDMGISSATIRNEMSDLEEMGLIIQPHASAGRIPSDLGYRLYVDHIMPKKKLLEEQELFIRGIVNRNITQINYLMEETARALSMLTNYTTVISEPTIKRTKLKQIRLLPLDKTSIMLIIATEENLIKNQILKVSAAPGDDELYVTSNKINNILQGQTLEDINHDTVRKLHSELDENTELLNQLINAIENTINSVENTQIHLSGTKNILAFPEFSDVEKAKHLFQTFEERDLLITLLSDTNESGTQVLIGAENEIEQMQGCSVIKTSYRLGDNTRGQIGIIGPTRMDYSQVISVLDGMVKNIESVLKMLTDNKNSP